MEREREKVGSRGTHGRAGLVWRGGGHEKTRRGREKEDEEKEKEDECEECEGKVSPPHCTAEHNAVVVQRIEGRGAK